MSKKVGIERVNLKNSCENTFVFKSQKVAATGYYDIEDSLPDINKKKLAVFFFLSC